MAIGSKNCILSVCGRISDFISTFKLILITWTLSTVNIIWALGSRTHAHINDLDECFSFMNYFIQFIKMENCVQKIVCNNQITIFRNYFYVVIISVMQKKNKLFWKTRGLKKNINLNQWFIPSAIIKLIVGTFSNKIDLFPWNELNFMLCTVCHLSFILFIIHIQHFVMVFFCSFSYFSIIPTLWINNRLFTMNNSLNKR